MKVYASGKEYDLDKIKAKGKKDGKYWLVHIPKQLSDTKSPFYHSWASFRRDHALDDKYHDAYWMVTDKSTHGFEIANEKYPI